MKLDRFRAPALAAAAVLMISGAGIAFAGNPATSTSTEPEGAADAAAQHAACLKVGIDDTVTPNVQYEDETGACSLDAGGTDNDGG